MVDEKLLEILVCPACKTKVVREGDRLVCQNPACGLRYPIRDDIPVMSPGSVPNGARIGPRPVHAPCRTGPPTP